MEIVGKITSICIRLKGATRNALTVGIKVCLVFFVPDPPILVHGSVYDASRGAW